ncbi:MAG: sulfatase-like hydrolase/transferase [Pirellulales bacterium]|nr:sulfatase-like hydrolase/transferase [Pirellulales bacterium]
MMRSAPIARLLLVFIANGMCASGLAWSMGNPNIVLIYADDMGWADLGANGAASDVLTPNLDTLAASGARFTDGYVTAPQCSPSRAGLMTGIYQQKFGFEWNIHGPLPLNQTTIAERLNSQGYVTGMAGKWHLTPTPGNTEWINANLNGDWSNVTEQDIAPYRSYNRGFTDAFEGQLTSIRATYDLAGNTLPQPTNLQFPGQYRVDLQTEAALAFLDRHAAGTDPFFLYLPYFSPHEPLEAPQEYLDRFPGEMPERRRYALAMNAAVDDGVGLIMDKLDQYNITQDTLVMFISDNGAQLKFDMPDDPLTQFGWNGSLNTPFVGQKATILEGGIRVPYVASWPGVIPPGTVYEEPVLQLDAAATAVAVAGGDISSLDGKNLIPHLTGLTNEAPHNLVYSRFGTQEAVREGDWKLLRMTNNQVWLFDMSVAEPERVNLAGKHPTVVSRLTGFLDNWVSTLPRAQFPVPFLGEVVAFNHFLPKPHTGVDPKVVIDLGYDQATSTNEVIVDQGNLQNVTFGGLRLGNGVSADLRAGASISTSIPGGGGQSFVGWDLPSGGSALSQAIATEHFLEFDVTFDPYEVLAIKGIQIFGAANPATNFLSLFASNDGFATDPLPGQQINNALLIFTSGDLGDPVNPVRNYQPIDFIPSSPFSINELETTWTFRLYVNEDGIDDLNPVIIHSIAFDVEELVPGDFNRDSFVDQQDLAIWQAAYGISAAGDADRNGITDGADFLVWQRNFTGNPPATTSTAVPEPQGLGLAICAMLATLLVDGGRQKQC